MQLFIGETNQNEMATGITGYICIVTDADDTDTAAVISGKPEEIGTLEAGGLHTTTKRIEFSIGDADRENGLMTTLTVVNTNEKTVRFQEREQAA